MSDDNKNQCGFEGSVGLLLPKLVGIFCSGFHFRFAIDILVPAWLSLSAKA
jgi:hypothetical protein